MASWPDPVPIGSEDGTPSPVLETLIRGPGNALPALVLVASPAGAAAVAIAVARAWVRTGRRIVLIDLGLQQPSLHQPLGAHNEEGIADHFLFGTSLDRLAQPVDDGSWGLVPAGPFSEDVETIVASPEWRRVLRDAARREATLLLYAPSDTPGLLRLTTHAGAVLDLGGAHALDGLRAFSVLAGFTAVPVPAAPPVAEAPEPAIGGPPEPPVAPPPVAEPAERPPTAPAVQAGGHAERLSEEEYDRIRLPKDARSREALIADLRARQRAALMHPAPDPLPAHGAAAAETAEGAPPAAAVQAALLAGALSPEAAGVLPEPTSPYPDLPLLQPPARKRVGAPPPPRTRRPLLYTLIAVALLSAVAAAWHFAGVWLDARRARAEAAAATAEPVRTPVAIPAVPALDTVLGYAVALEAHQRLPDAEQRVRSLRAAMPEPGFFIAPLVREDALYYHVMAGPVRDSASAAMLMDSLLAKRHKTGGTPADVRHAPLAFLLGEFASEDSATARVAELQRFEIPSYVLPLAGPPARWRVYAGGYGGSAEAGVMRELLQSAGASDSLVPRTARAPRQDDSAR